MRITIRFLLTFFIPVDVEPTFTIGDLKAHMEKTEGVLAAHQMLIFGGKKRADEMTISECEMKDIVHLIMKLPHPDPQPPKILEQRKQHLAAMYATGPPTSAPQAVVPVMSSTSAVPTPTTPATTPVAPAVALGKKKSSSPPPKPKKASTTPKPSTTTTKAAATKKATATTTEKGGKKEAPPAKKPAAKSSSKKK